MGSEKTAAQAMPKLCVPSIHDADALSHKAEIQSRQVSPASCLQELDKDQVQSCLAWRENSPKRRLSLQYGGYGMDQGSFSSFRHWFNMQHHSRSLKGGLAQHGSCLFRGSEHLSIASQPQQSWKGTSGLPDLGSLSNSMMPFCSRVVFLGPSPC